MLKSRIKKVVYNWGEQVTVGKGKLLFFSEELKLLPLLQEETSNYDIVGQIDYDFAYGIKKGFPGFAGGE